MIDFRQNCISILKYPHKYDCIGQLNKKYGKVTCMMSDDDTASNQ